MTGRQVTQQVSVVNGFGYGVVGADLYVLGEGVPVYLLLAAAMEEPPRAAGCARCPAAMPNAWHAVVGFTGREAELGDLRSWRNDGHRLAVQSSKRSSHVEGAELALYIGGAIGSCREPSIDGRGSI